MNRLEQLAKTIVDDSRWLDDPENREHAIKTEIQNYLSERNDFMAVRVDTQSSVVMQAAAREFDNAEVDYCSKCEMAVPVEDLVGDDEPECQSCYQGVIDSSHDEARDIAHKGQ